MFHITEDTFIALDPGLQIAVVLTTLLAQGSEDEDVQDQEDDQEDGDEEGDPEEENDPEFDRAIDELLADAAEASGPVPRTDVMVAGSHPVGPGGGYEESPDSQLWTFFLVRGRSEGLDLLRGLADAGDEGLVPDAFLDEVSRWTDPETLPDDAESFCGIELEGIHWALSQKEQLEPLKCGGLQWDQFLKDDGRRPVGILYGFRDEAGIHRLHLARSQAQVHALAARLEAWDAKGASYIVRDEDGDVARLPDQAEVPAVEVHGIIAERINTQWANVHGGEDFASSEEYLATLPPEQASVVRKLDDQLREGLERDRFKDSKGMVN